MAQITIADAKWLLSNRMLAIYQVSIYTTNLNFSFKKYMIALNSINLSNKEHITKGTILMHTMD